MSHYNLTEGFPIIALRHTASKSAVDELLWIRQKKSDNIHDLSSHIWNSWADEDDSTGKAYGYQLGVKHHYKEGGFDQVDRILYDLRYNSLSRRVMSNIHNHHDLCETNLYPCAYNMIFNVSGKTLNDVLSQRSQDMLTANSWNACRCAVLLHMLAQINGLKPDELVHIIVGVHIYDRHIPTVKELLKRGPRPGPTLAIDTSIQDFYQPTTGNFQLENYQYHTFGEEIPVAI